MQDACPESLAVLVGNKTDMAEHRRVTMAQGAALAEDEGMPFFEVRGAASSACQAGALAAQRVRRHQLGAIARLCLTPPFLLPPRPLLALRLCLPLPCACTAQVSAKTGARTADVFHHVARELVLRKRAGR